MRRRLFFALAFLSLAPAVKAQSLSLSDYLNQVKIQGSDYQSRAAAVTAYEKQTHEQDLIYSPLLTASYNHLDDTEQLANPLTQPHTLADTAGVSITALLPFGPKLTVGYVMQNTNYTLNPLFASASALFPNPYYQVAPVVSLSVPLFKDFGGAQTQAGVKKVQYEFQSLVNNAVYLREEELYDAKVAYWNLALARQALAIRQDTLDRTQKIWDWTKKRVARNLADPPDALQAEASVRLAALDLDMAQQQERSARLAFNRYRGAQADAVPEQLEDLQGSLDGLKQELPADSPERLDLKQAEANVSQQKAAYDEAHQNVYPDITATASWRGNGFDPTFGGANSTAFSTSYPTYNLGAQFNLPLDVFTAAQVADGFEKNYESAQMALKDKQLQVAQDWKDLMDKLSDVNQRLDMTAQIESIQKNKADQEKQRLEFGRTTEFQLLSFENDYNAARLNHLSVIAEKLSLLAKAQWWMAGQTPDASGETK
ncbi:MAG TPA: TolC family protein [bacterium]|nr:TolC family protein [bacterium]